MTNKLFETMKKYAGDKVVLNEAAFFGHGFREKNIDDIPFEPSEVSELQVLKFKMSTPSVAKLSRYPEYVLSGQPDDRGVYSEDFYVTKKKDYPKDRIFYEVSNEFRTVDGFESEFARLEETKTFDNFDSLIDYLEAIINEL